MAETTKVWVYADWKGIKSPKLIGHLTAQQAKGRKAFSFSYHKEWIDSIEQVFLDPDLAWYSGQQYPDTKENFGIFFDSMPDTWGRTLMKKRRAIQALDEGTSSQNLYDLDFLLGVHDFCRMGGIRLKTDPEGDFLDNNPQYPTPPWTSIRELQYSAKLIEEDIDGEEIKKWLEILMAPGTSLGGARPKANILDQEGNLWIAKFPSKNDGINKGAWEYLAYLLAIDSGIEMAESSLERISGNFDTFFTKRFDRDKGDRIHFASAMTMTGKNEEQIRDQTPSYLDILEFIQFSGVNVDQDLEQLWRRIVFNILISNTDDHLRNHGFILTDKGWRLSPAYDLNPSVDKNTLALNIDSDSGFLDLKLAKSVGPYFRLNDVAMNQIIDQVKNSVSNWSTLASEIGISRGEQMLMKGAFKIQ